MVLAVDMKCQPIFRMASSLHFDYANVFLADLT